MDDKNLYPAMIGKLREMLADSGIQIAMLQVRVDALEKELERLRGEGDTNGES